MPIYYKILVGPCQSCHPTQPYISTIYVGRVVLQLYSNFWPGRRRTLRYCKNEILQQVVQKHLMPFDIENHWSGKNYANSLFSECVNNDLKLCSAWKISFSFIFIPIIPKTAIWAVRTLCSTVHTISWGISTNWPISAKLALSLGITCGRSSELLVRNWLVIFGIRHGIVIAFSSIGCLGKPRSPNISERISWLLHSITGLWTILPNRSAESA